MHKPRDDRAASLMIGDPTPHGGLVDWSAAPDGGASVDWSAAPDGGAFGGAAYAGRMALSLKARRVAINFAYVGLRVYWFLLRPKVVGVKCVVVHGDRVLLVRHTYGRRSWDLPGGTVRRREVPIDAARREMHEELGRRIGRASCRERVFGRV